MAEDSIVTRYFADKEQTMRQTFEGWEREIPHAGEKGRVRERKVRGLLEGHLPGRYGVGSGHVIDSQSEPAVSCQTDVIVYDALNGIRVPADEEYSVLPCECVYAAIEVKSRLSASDGKNGPSGTVYECLETTARLKALNRAKWNLPPIHSIVFAYDTKWSQAPWHHVKRWFEHFGEKYCKKLPEMVVVLQPGFVLGTTGPSGYNETGKFTHIYENNPLLFFVSDLVHRLSTTPVATPNLWYEYVSRRSGDVIARIYKQ